MKVNTVRDRIKTLAEARGTTISGVEKELGIGNGTIGRWDASAPSADKLALVADYFDVTIDYLIGREGQEPDDDVMALREQLRSQPGMRMLFNAAKGVTKEELQNVANMIAAFKKED